ncbi:hypothetical protein LguiA_006236 [Lonicera macranthoides]
MKPADTTTTSTSVARPRLCGWNSPMPFLFGALVIMLVLIALALTILACSYKKSPSSNRSPNSEGKSARPMPEMEPKIVVIMAGDNNPSYLAKPASTIRHTEQV